MSAPMMGANQNSQSCGTARASAKNATPVERAGFTEVLVTGILIKWISVRHRPMAIGANPAGAARRCEPEMMVKLGYNASAQAILFVPEWVDRVLALPQQGAAIEPGFTI